VSTIFFPPSASTGPAPDDASSALGNGARLTDSGKNSEKRSSDDVDRLSKVPFETYLSRFGLDAPAVFSAAMGVDRTIADQVSDGDGPASEALAGMENATEHTQTLDARFELAQLMVSTTARARAGEESRLSEDESIGTLITKSIPQWLGASSSVTTQFSEGLGVGNLSVAEQPVRQDGMVAVGSRLLLVEQGPADESASRLASDSTTGEASIQLSDTVATHASNEKGSVWTVSEPVTPRVVAWAKIARHNDRAEFQLPIGTAGSWNSARTFIVERKGDQYPDGGIRRSRAADHRYTASRPAPITGRCRSGGSILRRNLWRRQLLRRPGRRRRAAGRWLECANGHHVCSTHNAHRDHKHRRCCRLTTKSCSSYNPWSLRTFNESRNNSGTFVL